MLCSSTPTFCHGKLIDLFSISMRPQLEVEVQHQCRRQSPFEALQQHFSSIAFGFLFIWAGVASQACVRTTKEPKGAEARSAKLCTSRRRVAATAIAIRVMAATFDERWVSNHS